LFHNVFFACQFLLSTRISILSTALVCASMGHALEASSKNEIRTLNSGLEQRLEATRSTLQAAFNNLQTIVNGFAARITTLETDVNALETDVTLIKSNGAKNEVQRWNPKLEARLDAIEAKDASQDTIINNHTTRITALENQSGGGLVYRGAFSVSEGDNTGARNYDLCVLTRAAFGTTNDNHAHNCTIGRSSAGYTLTATTVKGSTDCTMMCYDLQ
jgi:outer membrane murein-binding lipoprotein Lpp